MVGFSFKIGIVNIYFWVINSQSSADLLFNYIYIFLQWPQIIPSEENSDVIVRQHF